METRREAEENVPEPMVVQLLTRLRRMNLDRCRLKEPVPKEMHIQEQQ